MKSYWAFSTGGGNHQNVQRTSHTRRRSTLDLSLCSWLANLLFIGWMSVFYLQELRQFDISKVSFSTSEIGWSMKDVICLLGSLALSGSMMLLYIHFFRIIGEVFGIDKS